MTRTRPGCAHLDAVVAMADLVPTEQCHEAYAKLAEGLLDRLAGMVGRVLCAFT